MFLRTIGDANLLDTNELFALRDIPDDYSLRLAQTTVDYFTKGKGNEAKTLLTKEHCELFMEIIGRAFSLPIAKSEKVISGAITLYSKWMHFASAPKPIQQHAIYFSKKMCCHLSFVFENRNISADRNEFKTHVALCRRVLCIYSKSARSPPGSLSEQEWNEFLCRIYLGICDEVMKGPADSRSLGNDIEQDVFFCLFDIWLRSQLQNEALWKTLFAMANKEWVHRRWFIESWGQCCVALTRKLIHVLYGGENGADAVFVIWPVLGTNVISIEAMLAGRGSMIAPSKYNKSLSDHNANYEVRPNRFGSRGNPSSPKSSIPGDSPSASPNSRTAGGGGAGGSVGGGGGGGGLDGGDDSMKHNRAPTSMGTYIQIGDARLLIYLWNGILKLLDVGAINDPECFGCAIAWIARMVDMFLGVHVTCAQRKQGLLMADGNSILDIFSHELFTAAINMFEDARAIALGALCRIFSNKCDTAFKPHYLLQFHHTIHELLVHPSSIQEKAREQVILNGATLFACDFDGCRALIPIFIPQLRLILKTPQKPRLRLAAITMLCSFISLPWHFYHEQSTTTKLKQALSTVSDILLIAIDTEHNEYNLQKLLWCCSVYLCISSKYISKTHPFASKLVHKIWKHVEEETKGWPCHVITTAFKALTAVIEHVVALDTMHNNAVLNWRMLIEMCKYAQIHLGAGNQFDIDSRRVLAVACMKCLLIWLKNDASIIVSNERVSRALRDLIVSAMKLKANHGRNDAATASPQVPNTKNASSDGSINPGGGGGQGHGGDYDYSGNDAPPYGILDSMSFKSAQQHAANEHTNALKDVYRATDQLARFFCNDIGAYYQNRRHAICNSPIHRYAEAYLNETQIQQYIESKLLDAQHAADEKWHPHDRIRYFAYKKNRIITLIEMPRTKPTITNANGNSASDAAAGLKSMKKQPRPPGAPGHAVQHSAPDVSMPSATNITSVLSADSTLQPGAAAGVPSNLARGRSITTSATASTSNKNASVSGSINKEQYQRNHHEPRQCDVIVLIRDAYGKYAWEVSGINNDYDKAQQVVDILAASPEIVDNSHPLSGTAMNEVPANRPDMIARSLLTSTTLAERTQFHHDAEGPIITIKIESRGHDEKQIEGAKDTVLKDSKVANKTSESGMPSLSALVAANLTVQNQVRSPASYWSSLYIKDNWRFQQQQQQMQQRQQQLQVIASQRSLERNTHLMYTEYQYHPLKNVEYERQHVECKSDGRPELSTLSSALPYNHTADMFSASTQHELPTQDDAATFMHSRRLLSSLGFLRPNQATGVARYVEILDEQPQNENIGELDTQLTLTEYLHELDLMSSLDQIAVSILYHNDGDEQLSDFDILGSSKSTKSRHTDAFEYFLSAMGNRVAYETHVGFKGNLAHDDCDKFPYFSDSICGELAYIVPSELKTTTTPQRKKELYLSTCIRIIWSETAPGKNCPLWLTQQFTATHRHPNAETPVIYIRITAQSHGLYRVSINGEAVLPHLLGNTKKKKRAKEKSKKKRASQSGGPVGDDTPTISTIGAAHTNTTTIPTTGFERVIIGPLVDGMVVSESVLPDLVRKTIVNASNLITELMNDSLSIDAKERRERLILEVSAKFEKYRSSNQDKYYEYFFINPEQEAKNNVEKPDKKLEK